MTHRLPPAPRKRTFGLPVRRQAPTNTMERLRTMGRRHQEEERPFDPERQGERWQGSSRDLVVNASQFYSDLREMVALYHGHLNTDLSVDEIVDELKRAFKEEDTDDAMSRANELLEGHGVEALGPVNMRHGPPYLYLNFGDAYASTLMWSRDGNKFFVGSWGDVVPEMETNLLEEEWGSWLQRDFTKKVLSQLEDDEFDDLERAEEILDSWDADAFSKLVWDTQQNTKSSSGKYPEVTTESDGIYVHHLDTVVDRAVELFKEKRYSPNSTEPRQYRMGSKVIDFDHVETRGVLAGAYRSGSRRGRRMDDERTMLTHIIFVQSDGNELRTGCSQPLDHMVDTFGASAEARRGEEPPTCPRCLGVWTRIKTHKSRAILPDGRAVILTWEGGDCLDAQIDGESVDLFSIFGSREDAEAWLDERAEARPYSPNAAVAPHIAHIIERARACHPETLTLDRFTYEDEVALFDACEDFYRFEDVEDGPDQTDFFGPDRAWSVSLVGDGDPR